MNYVLSSLLMLFVIITICIEIYSMKAKSIQLILMILFFSCILFYCIGYAMELLSATLADMLFWNKFQYIGIPFIPALILIYFLYSNNQKKYLSPAHISLILAIPFACMVARYTNSLHHLFYTTYYVEDAGFPVLRLVRGPIAILLYGYNLFCCVCCARVMLRDVKLRRENKTMTNKIAMTMFHMTLLPFVALLVNILNVTPIDWVPFSFLLSMLLILWFFRKYRIANTGSLLLYELQSNEKILRMILDSIDNVILLFDRENEKVRFVNDRYLQMFGQVLAPQMEPAMAQLLDRVHPQDREMVTGKFALIQSENCPSQNIVYRFKSRDGAYIWVRTGIRKIEDDQGKKPVIVTITNINEEHKVFEALTRKAEFDTTGVYNRATIFEKIQDFFETHAQENRTHALVLFDIDNLKHINDTYGHSMGDRIIEGLTKILQSEIRGNVILGRLGGDEFVAFLPDIPSREYVEQILERVIKKCAGLQYENSIDIPVSVSIGIVEAKDATASLQELYEKADIALYRIKNHNKNGYCFYEETEN